MQTTDNYSLKVYEGTDLFNPLTVENANTQAIDEAMKDNADAGIQQATELVSGTVHAITRTNPDAPFFKFTAVSKFTAGDTFTVDGTQVSALTTSGEQLPDGAYIIGSEVLAVLKGTLLTFFISSGKVSVAEDAEKLGGQLPDYYGTAEDVNTAQETATAAGTLAGNNQTAINTINENLGQKQSKTWIKLGTFGGNIWTSSLTGINPNEVMAIVNCQTSSGSNVYSLPFSVPYSAIATLSTTRYFELGATDWRALLQVADGEFAMTSVVNGGTSYISNCSMEVYYR